MLSMTSADLTTESEGKTIYSASGLILSTVAIAPRLGLMFRALCSSWCLLSVTGTRL